MRKAREPVEGAVVWVGFVEVEGREEEGASEEAGEERRVCS